MTNYDDPSSPLPDFPGNFEPDASGVRPVLDNEETSEHPSVVHSYRRFLISGQSRKVAIVRSIYSVVGSGDPESRLSAYDSCRENAWFVGNIKSGHVKVASSRCGLRWCPLCEKTRRLVIINSVLAWIEPLQHPKFMTLTLKHSESPLSVQISSLYGFFKELRRRPFWQKHVKNGYWFFQVKVSETDGLFHPHLHIIFTGRFTPHDELSAEWNKVTHGSKIVDVRAVKDKKKAAEYVARYAACPCDLSKMHHDVAVEVVSALHNRRICGAFGSAREFPLSPQKPVDLGEWKFLGSFRSVLFSMQSLPRSELIFKSWRSGEPLPFEFFPNYKKPPNEVYSASTVEVDTYKQALLF